jgi:site-specific recombinase XerC
LTAVAAGIEQNPIHRKGVGLRGWNLAQASPGLTLSTPTNEEGRFIWWISIARLATPVDEVARFWSSFRNSRDLAIVELMLLQGLRSQEFLDLNRDDLLLSEAQIRVRGKGNKIRFLPLAPEANQLLDHYLRLERPQILANALFVSLKGPARGVRMTPAGLRSLFLAQPLPTVKVAVVRLILGHSFVALLDRLHRAGR